MTIYTVFDAKPGKPDLPAAIPEQFSWLAALLPPVFLLMHGLWLETLAWLLGVVALVLATPLIGGAAAFWLYVLGAAWMGFAAPSFRRHALQSRGWRYRGERVATGADMAQLEALR